MKSPDDYKEFYEELMVVLQSMAAVSGDRLTCCGKIWDGFSLVYEGEEIGNALSAYRALLIIHDGSPVEMAKCFYTEMLLPLKKAGVAESYEVGLKGLESVLNTLWGNKTVASEHLAGLVKKYG
ncbi:MAG: hypothetical protein ABSD38_30760 [Syntrophorhabdales bacterium]|jgi:hypothetical protein